jgi:hypothetical protein
VVAIIAREELAGVLKTAGNRALRERRGCDRLDHARRGALDDMPRHSGSGLWIGRQYGFADPGCAPYPPGASLKGFPVLRLKDLETKIGQNHA